MRLLARLEYQLKSQYGLRMLVSFYANNFMKKLLEYIFQSILRFVSIFESISLLTSEGSGFEDDSYRLEEIDRERLMVALADLDYILVRATHGEAADTIG